jgi:mycothiol system anti-sigma-R factor
MGCEEAQELITALVDNELTGSERDRLQTHLAGCSPCQRAYAAEAELKQSVQRSSAVVMPATLRRRIERNITTTAGKPRAKEAYGLGWWLNLRGWRPMFTTALVLVGIALGIYFRWPPDGVVTTAIATHQDLLLGKTLLVRTDSPVALREQMARAVGGRFAPMAFDFSTIGLYPVAGFAQKIGGREVLVTVYEGRGPAITCYTLLGSEADAPANAERFFDADMKMSFYSYSRDGVNALLHKEGNVICILVSKMPSADLLALLRGKSAHA